MTQETWDGAPLYDGRPPAARLEARLRRDGVDPALLREVVLTCEALATGRLYHIRALGYLDAGGWWYSYCLRSDGRIRRRRHDGAELVEIGRPRAPGAGEDPA
jgi:hypothetical protein